MWKYYFQNIKLPKKYPIHYIVTVCFFVVLILQSFIISINFSLLRTDDKLSRNTYSYIMQKADDASKQIERSMADLWSNPEYIGQIESAINKNRSRSNVGPPLIDEDFGMTLIDTMSLMKVSGVFVAFNEVLANDVRPVIHLKDANENIRFSNNSDITMKVGSDKIAETLGISLESSWRPYQKRSGSDSEFVLYDTVLHYAEAQDPIEYRDHGFWLSPLQDDETSEKNIYYIRPLYHKNSGELYCVIGIEISRSLIDSLLEYAHLSDSDKSAYLLISDQEQTRTGIHWHIISSKGPYVQRLIKDSSLSASKVLNKYYDPNAKVVDSRHLYQIHSNTNEKLLAIPRPVRLAFPDLHRNSKRWFLMAVVDQDEIEIYSKELKNSFLEMLLISLLISILVIQTVSRIITYPLILLSDRIKRFNDHNDPEMIDRLNITEIDHLIDTIENLSIRLTGSSQKFQKIVESAAIPFVAIEIDAKHDKVHRLGNLSGIFRECCAKENFEEILTVEQYLRWHEYFCRSGELIESSYDQEKDSQIEVYKRSFEDQHYYVKVISKRIECYEQTKRMTAGSSERSSEVQLMIIMDHTKEIQERLNIQKERDFDTLTGLMNRYSFQNAVQEFLNKDPLHHKKAAMIMWDLDNLKYVNDTYGHDRGDEYLQLAGQVLSTLKSDRSYVARVSGDEFFVFIEYDGNKDEIREKLHQIKEQLFESSLEISSHTQVKVRATTGFTWYPEDSTKFDELKKFADFAMYTAKHSAKGGICEFDRSLYDKNYILFSGKESLNEFIEQRQLRFAFQPIVSARDGEVYGYEALMRSTSSQINNVGDVMRLAKAQSRLRDIEILTFEEALAYFEKHQSTFNDKYLFINSIASVSLPKDLMPAEKYHTLLNKVVVEIIESEDLDTESMDIKQKMKQKHRCRIAIDDFGTGYATESRLLQVDPDFIKIDMSLIRNIHHDIERQTIVSNILRYTRSKNIKVIGEGVETEEEMKKLIEMGIDYIQGYYIAKPNFDIITPDPDKILQIRQIYSTVHDPKHSGSSAS
ncbi:MAG: EAL domain-containing protein [Peptostreptococcaceae bacterium]|nr:EAL domain-containing protein [Peptostreptococcaceae bacterium]